MKTVLICVGRTDASWLREGVADYVSRLTHFCPFEMLELPDVKSRGSEAEQCRAEGVALLAKLQLGDQVILLDERGKQWSSKAFAEVVQRLALSGSKRLVFVIGGPYGFDAAVRQRANALLSLSTMTFSHQMVRLIFVEQLYRAHTILRGLPYHHE